MTALFAHAGEELLIPAAIVLLILLVPMVRRRAKRSFEEDREEPAAADQPEAGRVDCEHCGAQLTSGADRCPACGFRVRR